MRHILSGLAGEESRSNGHVNVQQLRRGTVPAARPSHRTARLTGVSPSSWREYLSYMVRSRNVARTFLPPHCYPRTVVRPGDLNIPGLSRIGMSRNFIL